jgi:hypothetical protein
MKTQLACLSVAVALSAPQSGAARRVLDGQAGLAVAPSAAAGAPALRGAANNKLWVLNNCGSDTALYFGARSLQLPAEYTAEGGAPWAVSSSNELVGADALHAYALGVADSSSNPSIWVDAADIANCFGQNCNAMGKSLAEFTFNAGPWDWLDISYVKGFNYPVQIEVLGSADVGHSPRNVACQDPACKDSFMLCDTALTNVVGGAPNWRYPVGAGLTYKVTFCHDSANTDNNNNSNRDYLQRTLPRYTQLPLPADKPMVWCACEFGWPLTTKVFNFADYTQFNGTSCGAVQ